MIVIKGGTVYTNSGWEATDVAIEETTVTEVGSGLTGDAVIDASGCLVGPGFVDLHTHLREPGQTWKEDIASGSRAAAAGGFTAVVAMPNTEPAIDSPKVAATVASLGVEAGLVDVVPCGALTQGRMGTVAADIEGLYDQGVRLFSDDGHSVADPDLLANLMEMISELDGAVVAQHAEDASISADGHMHEGSVSRALGVGGLSAAAEAEIVKRDLELVRATGARYHCQHTSSKMTVEMISQAKLDGLPVTAEVAPHHLSFTDEDVRGLDTNLKMYPPLRTAEDRAALIAGLTDGTIDAVATDHAPHAAQEKSVQFSAAPRGVIGLETAASVTWDVLRDRERLFRVLSTNPARIANLPDQGQPVRPGAPANLVVFDPYKSWTVSHFFSRSANSPYLGRQLQGKVLATFYRGNLTHRDGDT